MRKMLLFSLFALVIPLRAASPPIGAVVVSWDVDSTKNTVTLHLANDSGKDITFYNVSIKEIYGLAVNEHQFSQELPDVSMLIHDTNYLHGRDLAEYHHGGNGTWQAGARRDVPITVHPGLTHFEAVLDAVTYSDNTAEGSNGDALQRELDHRTAAAATLRAANEVIRRTLANTVDQSPHETAAKEMEGLQKKWESSGHVGTFSPGTSGGVISELREAPRAAAYLKQTLPDYLTHMISRNERMASVLGAKVTGGAK